MCSPRWAAFVPLALALALVGCGPADRSGSEPEVPVAGFAPEGSCVECHAEQQSAWRGSHHDRSRERASEHTVRGDFDDAVFTRFGVTTRFRRRDGRFFVETEGAAGRAEEFEIVETFGVEPLQQYLVDFGGGRLQSLTIAWDTERGRWFSLYPDERIEPGDPLHWTGRLQRWNTMCADCHSTALVRAYDFESGTYATSWAEHDVGCQACHGGGAAHAASARAARGSGEREVGRGVASTPVALPVRFDADEPQRELEVCAPCHSRRHRVSADPVIGEPFSDHYGLELLEPDLYHADGQVRGEVYVYGSFIQSLMHRRGVRCTDCHEPHTARLRASGNALCARCHGPQPNPAFPTLTPRLYDSPDHHGHPEGSPGSLCVECHMPEQVFMQVDGRRDHSLRVPRPDLSIAIGTPNACTGCHPDRDAAWAVEEIARRRPAGASPRPHYGPALSAARELAPGAAVRLASVVADPGVPGIARATGVSLIPLLAGAAGVDVVGVAIGATRDEDPLVRTAAARALEYLPGERALAALAALLRDPRRTVRVEAARVLAGAPPDRFSQRDRAAFGAALEEFRAAQRALSDTPSAHLNLAVVHHRRGEYEAAEAAYLRGLKLAPDFVPARVNLANLYNALGRNEDAERQLRAALEAASARPPMPDDASRAAARRELGELHYSLGLLHGEQRRLEAAAEEFARAVDLIPARVRVRYNYGLTLQRLGRRAEAEAVLLEAAKLDAEDAAVQTALAILYLQDGRLESARARAERAVVLTGGAPEARALLQRIGTEGDR